MKHAYHCLLALLPSPYKKRLVHRSWSHILLDDIYYLIGAFGSRLAKLGDPQLTPHAWAICMRKHTGMMKNFADGFLRSHAKASPVTSPTSIPTRSFWCGTCDKKFPTLQAGSTHEWTVHKRRQIGADCINESGRWFDRTSCSFPWSCKCTLPNMGSWSSQLCAPSAADF